MYTRGSEHGESGQELTYFGIASLTFEAVLEVVIVCVMGFIAARGGILNVQGQKVLSQMNVDIFTPCLVFIKLAPSLSLLKLKDIFIIPVFYAVSTGIAYICSIVTSKLLHLNHPETDFVTAMAVFGNSNSLPVSLTMSLSYTLPNLLWDDIPDDDSDKVASRGILYLLIFQQLGQILRWSWGYNTLLRSRHPDEIHSYHGGDTFHLEDDDENTSIRADVENGVSYLNRDSSIQKPHFILGLPVSQETVDSCQYEEGEYQHESIREKISVFINECSLSSCVSAFLTFMNPPLYAMLVSVIVASIPALQNAFFGNSGGFVYNTVTSSIKELAGVSIPLILVVLGSNLYPNSEVPPASKHYDRIIFASLLSRMILPSFILLPIIALCVKYIKLSILDDPIFLIVAFILTISPPAIQLSQIVQLNNIYQKEMAGVLFWGYVVLTLPTTIFIVVVSLEVLRWATA